MSYDLGGSALRYLGLGETSGYAAAAAMTVRALRDIGVDVVWEPLLHGESIGLYYEPAASPEAGPADLVTLRDDGRAAENVVVCLVPEYYPYFLARERARGAKRILGQTTWETDRLPAHWPALINQLDAVIVPSQWNRQVFAQSGVTVPILVSPHLPQFGDLSVDPGARASLRPRLPEPSGRRIFYTISTWLERKGLAPLVEAFTEAFDHDDPVALVIKTTPYDLERIRRDPGHEGERVPVLPQFEAMIGRAVMRHRRLPPPISLVTDDLSVGEMRALHEFGDVFVSLSRGEGWGLGAFEAAWLGKPVIVTGWSGPTAFLSPETAYFVDWSPAPASPGEANASYTPDQNWAEPDVASAVAALRAVVADPDEAARRGARAAAHLRQTIEPSRVAEQLWRDIQSVVPRPRSATPPGGRRRSSLRNRLLRAVFFRREAGLTGWLRETLLVDRRGRLRAGVRALLVKRNGLPRRPAADWLESFAPASGQPAEARYLRRIERLVASGQWRRASRVRILASRDKQPVADAIESGLALPRLVCRRGGAGSLDLGADLYVVVDPQDLPMRPPAERAVYVLSRAGEAEIDSEFAAFLSRGLAVCVMSAGALDALRGFGLPGRQVYLVTASSARGMGDLLARALHGCGVLGAGEDPSDPR